MIEKPILFSGEMVRAILDGRKGNTRRIVTRNWCSVNGPAKDTKAEAIAAWNERSEDNAN